MKNRTVKSVLFAHEYAMGKLRVKQPFPSAKVEYPDPFLLLHHAKMNINPENNLKNEGVGPHPHRGFSPVTFIFEGGVHHRDSRGNDSVIYKGGVQWMNAGMGIIHSERPPLDIHTLGSTQEIIQMWVNTPADAKMKEPEYHPLTSEETPVWTNPSGKTTVKVVTGSVLGLNGPIPIPVEVNSATIYLKKDETIYLPLPVSHEAFLYLLDGSIHIEEYGKVEKEHSVFFEKDGEQIGIKGLEDTRILFMSGEPINEPMKSHGPFVMNTESQLLVAMRDYQMGKMGVLIED
ncbi:MAG: pirin family protein [Bacteroidia bacterium]